MLFLKALGWNLLLDRSSATGQLACVAGDIFGVETGERRCGYSSFFAQLGHSLIRYVLIPVMQCVFFRGGGVFA